MAAEPKFTRQFPVVCTPTQREKIEQESRQSGMSLAAVVRMGLDERYGLTNGEEPDPSTSAKG